MKNIRKTIAVLLCVLSLCSVVSLSSFATDIPAKPSKLVASSVKTNSLKLAWTASSGANFYRVYVKSSGKWKALKDTTATSYSVSGLTMGKTYTFAVKSGLKQSGRVYLSNSYASVNVKTKTLSATKVIAASNENAVKLMWAKVSGVKGYSVYQKISGEWKVIANVASDKNTYTIKNLKSNTSYQFAVRGFALSGSKKAYAPASNIIKIKTAVSNKVTLTGTVVDDSSVKLKWSKAPQATGYRVFRYINGGWVAETTINSTKTLTYVVEGLESDTKNKFAVRAFKRSGSSVKWYTISDACTVITDPSEEDLSLYRTKKLRNTFDADSFTFSYTSYNDQYIKNPVTIAKKGSNYYLKTTIDGSSYSLINASSGSYIMVESNKVYLKVPKGLTGLVSVKNAVADLLPDDDFTGDTRIETFEGKKAVCETYSNSSSTKTLNYYYKAGSLIGIEELDYFGRVQEKAVVTSLSKSSKSALFSVPSGYKKVL